MHCQATCIDMTVSMRANVYKARAVLPGELLSLTADPSTNVVLGENAEDIDNKTRIVK